MKRGLWLGLVICAIGIGMVLPVTSVNAIPPPLTWGATFGTVGFAGDTFWQSTPAPAGWSTVYNHADGVAGNYWTGIEFFDLNYRNFNIVPPPPYMPYIEEALIPWVAFQLSDGNWYRYDHNDDPANGGSPNGHLMFLGGLPGNPPIFQWNYLESPTQPNPATILWANYILDMNGDGNTDWTFQETVILQGDFGGGWVRGGQGSIMIQPITWPPGGWIQMVPGALPLRIITIEYGFIIDADVFGWGGPNNIFLWNGFGWGQIINEMAFAPLGGQANGDVGMIQDPLTNLDVMIRPLCNLGGLGWPFSQNCYALAYNPGGEYSQHPLAYLNGAGTVFTDVLFWYVEDIAVDPAANLWPPPNAPEGIYFEDLR